MGSANTDHGSWTRHLATLTFLLILPASAELTISESDSNLLGSPSRFSRTPSLLETPLPPSAIQSDRILKSILRSKQDDEEDDVLLASSISPVRKALTFQPDQSSGEDDNGANSLSSPRTAGVGSQPRDRKINAPNPRELVFRAIRERRKLPSSSRKGQDPDRPHWTDSYWKLNPKQPRFLGKFLTPLDYDPERMEQDQRGSKTAVLTPKEMPLRKAFSVTAHRQRHVTLCAGDHRLVERGALFAFEEGVEVLGKLTVTRQGWEEEEEEDGARTVPVPEVKTAPAPKTVPGAKTVPLQQRRRPAPMPDMSRRTCVGSGEDGRCRGCSGPRLHSNWFLAAESQGGVAGIACELQLKGRSVIEGGEVDPRQLQRGYSEIEMEPGPLVRVWGGPWQFMDCHMHSSPGDVILCAKKSRSSFRSCRLTSFPDCSEDARCSNVIATMDEASVSSARCLLQGARYAAVKCSGRSDVEIQECVIEDSLIGVSALKHGAVHVEGCILGRMWGSPLHAEDRTTKENARDLERESSMDRGMSERESSVERRSERDMTSTRPEDREGSQRAGDGGRSGMSGDGGKRKRRRGTRMEIADCQFDDLPWCDLDRPTRLMGAQNVLILRGVMDPVGASELDVGWLQSASLKVEDGKAIEVQLTDRLELPEQGIGAEAKGNWIPTGARLMIERELKQAREQGRDVVEEVLANLESGGDRDMSQLLSSFGHDAASLRVLMERGGAALLESMGLIDDDDGGVVEAEGGKEMAEIRRQSRQVFRGVEQDIGRTIEELEAVRGAYDESGAALQESLELARETQAHEEERLKIIQETLGGKLRELGLQRPGEDVDWSLEGVNLMAKERI